MTVVKKRQTSDTQGHPLHPNNCSRLCTAVLENVAAITLREHPEVFPWAHVLDYMIIWHEDIAHLCEVAS